MIVNSSTRINTLWRENIRAVVFCETDPIVGGSIGKVLFRTEQCTVPAAGLLKYGVRVSWCQNKIPRRALFSRATQGDENYLNHIAQFYCRGSSSVGNDWLKPPTRLIRITGNNFCNLVIRCGDEGTLHLAGVDYLLLQHAKLSLHRFALVSHNAELFAHSHEVFSGLLVSAAQREPLQASGPNTEKTDYYQQPSRANQPARYRYQWGFVGALAICVGAALIRASMELFYEADKAARFSPAAWIAFLIGGGIVVHGLIYACRGIDGFRDLYLF
jgi:hypothetical protein